MANNVTFDESDIEQDRRSTYGVDSDDESLIDVDSPADGYFANREHPRATFVENPYQQSEDKAQEAAQERRPAGTMPTAGAQPAAPTRQRPVLDATTPLLDAGPAPPSYYQATGGRGAPPQAFVQGPGLDTNYGSISSPSRSQRQGQTEGGGGDAETLQSPVSFSSEHPLVRNGLFNEQGVLSGRSQEPQNMSDPAQVQQHQPHASFNSASHIEAGAEEPPNESDAGRDEESGYEPIPPYRDHHHHHLGHWRHPHHLDLKKSKKWRTCCRSIKKGCFNILLIIVLIIMLILFTSSRSGNESSDNPHSRLPVDTPTSPGVLPVPEHRNTSQCIFDSTSTLKSYDFYDPKSFSFLEMIESSEVSLRRIGGKIRISPFPSSTTTGSDSRNVAIRVWVRAAVTAPWLINDLRVAKDEDGFQLGFPDMRTRSNSAHVGGQASERPCLDFAVLVQVRRDIEIHDWDISTANLDVDIEKDIFEDSNALNEISEEHEETGLTKSENEYGLSILNKTSIYAIRGHIHTAYWSSRRTRIITSSGSISGTYALRDSLYIESHSGSINVGVEPKKAAEEDPTDAPADLVVKSISGSLDVEFPTRYEVMKVDIPIRQYRTRIETSSSSIHGRYLLGTTTSISSYSGTINAYILPVSANAWNQSLYTTTTSSSTSLTLLAALTQNSNSRSAESVDDISPSKSKWQMGSIDSVHKSISGTLNLHYPGQWSGMIEGRSTSGSINVKGKGVEIIEDDKFYGMRKLKAKKGSGNSKLTFKTVSSSVNIEIGDE